MKIGIMVRVKADEPEYIGKYANEIGKTIGISESGYLIVRFDDGQIMYFNAYELEAVE